MKIVDLGTAGQPVTSDAPDWNDLGIPATWRKVIDVFAPGSRPHDIQCIALRDRKLLSSRRNIIVSGPTNSGKSLIGYLAILQGLSEGRRALLLEPYRALAQEKFDELRAKLPIAGGILRKEPSVVITTGDYRLAGETFMTDPPKEGQIVIATPERIDAIMRNPDFDPWIASFGVVCVDEAHLLGDNHRGPSLEGVLTRMLCQKTPPRFILLSATLGGYSAIQEWLNPCDVAHSTIRRPPLEQQVIVLDESEKADDIVLDRVATILQDAGAAVLVFVYRTGDAARLAKLICDKMGTVAAAPYHSKMPSALKAETRERYEKGATRCLVSTTALGAGVNLPATHVIVRDLTFMGEGPLPLRDLLQMMGRAGRGTRPGQATGILKPRDDWKGDELTLQIRKPDLPDLQSSLLSTARPKNGSSRQTGRDPLLQSALLVLSQLVRREATTLAEILAYFERSLGGKAIAYHTESALMWLSDSQRLLAWKNPEGGWGTTTLGRAVTRSGVPLDVGAGIGVLIRDLLSCDPEDHKINEWSTLDTLIVHELVIPRARSLKRFNKDMTEQIDDWLEKNTGKSVLFSNWIKGTDGASHAEEVLGSLGVQLEAKKDAARRYAYAATARAIIITELTEGKRCEDVSRRWNVPSLEGVEEQWRDHLLWLLAGFTEVLDIKCFYHHLKEECQADQERIARVKKLLGSIRKDTFDLLGGLRFCSPLGPLFRDLEAAGAGVGVRTKEKLEAMGITNLLELSAESEEELVRAGVRRNLVRKLKAYTTKRLR